MPPKRPDRVTVRDLVEYSVFRIAFTTVCALGLERACALARFLGRVFHRFDRRRRETADSNLRHAFPELDAAARDRIARESVESFLVSMVEGMYTSRVLGPTRGRWRLRVEGFDAVARDVGSGPAVFVTGHLGNWEVLGSALGLLGYPLHSVARTFPNPLMQRFTERQRGLFGQRILPKRGGVRAIMEVIRSGGHVGIVNDQDAGRRGVFAEFLGRPASTFPTPATIALRFGCPIITGCCVRIDDRPYEFRVIADGAIEVDRSAPREEETLRVVGRINERLERYVRAYPSQYLWQHRRWKTQPDEEGAIRARESRRRERIETETR